MEFVKDLHMASLILCNINKELEAAIKFFKAFLFCKEAVLYANFLVEILLIYVIPSQTPYSVVPNKRTEWNNRAGYYIGLVGHYIKNHVLFNKNF